MEELAIKIEHVSKQYRLGGIGGGTLQADLQSWWARKQGREDPNSKIGAKDRSGRVGERFLALDDINLEVKKGEALGIIGHNGAGKSTLLKLLSRVTAPTEGKISYNGRITSMLEVGTGFHRELTGRENIYMNGAILGMTKKEIDAKMEQIIEFSEVRQFIDTPVKRYSSGMYVKLAFSVAAHLDSEIMIMDEVLAVGDMAFQKKCLEKMRNAAKVEGRTVLYVSHNMNTIRRLCDRCIVLDKGHIVFDGPVEEAISIYVGMKAISPAVIDLANFNRSAFSKGGAEIQSLHLESHNAWRINVGETVRYSISVKATKVLPNLYFRTRLTSAEGMSVSVYKSPVLKENCQGGDHYCFQFEADTSWIAPGSYYFSICVYGINEYGNDDAYDHYDSAVSFEVVQTEGFNENKPWQPQYAGYIVSKQLTLLDAQ